MEDILLVGEKEKKEEEMSFHDSKNPVTLILLYYLQKNPNYESKNCHFKCIRCKIPNHSNKSSRFKKKRENNEEKKTINFSIEDDTNQLFFSSINDNHIYNKTWYLDCGYNNHVLVIEGHLKS